MESQHFLRILRDMKIIYVYGLLDENDNITYVGKSASPKRRLSDHGTTKKCKILDKFEDVEHYWIKKLTEEGNQLTNKEKLIDGEDWEVGNIVELNNYNYKAPVRILHKPSGVIYDSVYQAAQELNIPNDSFGHSMRKHPKSKYHEIFTLLED